MKKTFIIIFVTMLMALSGNAWAQCSDGNTNCFLVINGYDSGQDGWNGASITFSQNNTVIGTFTLSGWVSSYSDTIRLCTTSGPVSCTWARGGLPFECSFTIFDSIGTLLYSCSNGYYLTNGAVFTTLLPCPSCSDPTGLFAQSLTDTSATMVWSGTIGTEWLYLLTTTEDPVGEWESSTFPSLILNGLQNNTNYWFHLRTYCNEGDTSDIVSTYFHTECGTTRLPVVESFEDQHSNFAYCWEVLEQAYYAAGGSVSPCIRRSTGTPYGVNSSSAVSLVSVSGNVSFRSPKIPLVPSEIEVSFWAHGDDALLVGYVTTDAMNEMNFHMVDSVIPTSTYSQYTVRFDTVTCTDSVYVVFRKAYCTSTQQLLVDDIVIRRYLPCSEPADLEVTADLGDALGIAWHDTVGTQWQVACGLRGFDPDSAVGILSTHDTNAMLTGLNDSTVYDIYVRSVCGVQHGYWVGPLTTMTNMHVMANGIDSVTACSLNIVDDGGITSSFSINGDQTLTIRPASEDSVLHLTGWVRLGSNIYYPSTLKIYDGVDTTGRLLATYTTVPEMRVNLVSETGPITLRFQSCSSLWYVNDGFQFHVQCVPSGGCPTPYGLSVTSVEGTSVDVSWSYDTTLAPDGFIITAYDTLRGQYYDFSSGYDQRNYTLTGLDERTVYQLRLRALCYGVESSADSLYCTTDCANGGYMSIGIGNTTSRQLPGFLYFSYGVGQQIYTSSEVEGITEVSGLQFYVDTLGTGLLGTSYRFDIYIDTTSQAFYTDTQLVQQNSAHRFFSGQVDLVPGLNTLFFDSTYHYPGSGNLVLTINTLNGSIHEDVYLRASTLTRTRSVCASSYYSAIDPTSTTGISLISSGSRRLTNLRTDFTFITACNSPNCHAPEIVSVVPSSTSVFLTWNRGIGASAWTVSYRHVDSADWTMASVGILDTFCTVTGLDAATSYFFRVSSICDAYSASSVVGATTLCSLAPLPFIEGFEDGFVASTTTALTHNCWHRGSSNVSVTGPAVDSIGYLSGHSVVFGGYRSYLVLPRMEEPVNRLALDFYAFVATAAYGNQQIEVGVASDPEDTASFTIVNMYSVEEGGWRLIHTEFDGCDSGVSYIFVRLHSDAYAKLYVDSLMVDFLPSCLMPRSVRIDTVMPTSVTLTVDDPRHVGSYVVYYNTLPHLATADSLLALSSTLTLGGLSENTVYYLWLRTHCSDGEMSAALQSPTVRTLCQPFGISRVTQWVEDFEYGDLDCMWQPSVGGRWRSTLANAAMHAWSGYSMVKATGEAMLVLPTYSFSDLDTTAELNLCLYQTAASGGLTVSYRVGTTGAWMPITTLNGPWDTWQRYSVALPASPHAATYQVALTTDTVCDGLYVDDLAVRAAPWCRTPTAVGVRDVTERTATVAWVGEAPRYKVQYRQQGNWSWNARTAVGVDTMVIGPLDMASDYEVRVTAWCDDYTQSDPSPSVTFTTAICADRWDNTNYTAAQATTTAPHLAATAHAHSYTEVLVDSARLAGLGTIDGLAFNPTTLDGGSYLGNCRIYIGTTTAEVMNSFRYDSTYAMVYNGSMNFDSTGWRYVRFDTPYVWDGSSNLVVGILYRRTQTSGPISPASYAAHRSTTHKVYTAYSDSYAINLLQANSLPASVRQASDVVPDLLLYGCSPVCYAPMVGRVATTSSSVMVEWYDEGATVQLQIKEARSDGWGDTVVVGSGHSYSFFGLTDSTVYDIRLRQDCAAADGGSSDWVSLSACTMAACPIPTDLHLVDIGNNSVVLGWTGEGERWQLRIWNSEGSHTFDATTNPFTVYDLAPGVYHATVRTCCSDREGDRSEESAEMMFENICYPVGQLNAIVQSGAVVLRWIAGRNNQRWMVSYGYRGFDLNQQLGYMLVDTTVVRIEGLAWGATYGFRVRAYCDDDWNSDWSAYEVTVTLEGVERAEGVDVAVSVCPNPATGQATIGLEHLEGQATLTAVDLMGRKVATWTMTEPSMTIDVGSWTAGMYFLYVRTADGMGVERLIVR